MSRLTPATAGVFPKNFETFSMRMGVMESDKSEVANRVAHLSMDAKGVLGDCTPCEDSGRATRSPGVTYY